MEHPEELSRVAGLQKKVDEVKNVMVDNIEQVGDAAALPIMPPRGRNMLQDCCHHADPSPEALLLSGFYWQHP